VHEAEALSMVLIKDLLKAAAWAKVYDPAANEYAKAEMNEKMA